MKKLYFLLLTILITTTSFGQVFITELADPNDNANARYIELYNAGATSVDLNNWRIDKYTNASATVSQTLTLTGTIPAEGFYIIATGPMDTAVFDAWGVTPDQWDPASNDVAGSNGDDNLELYNASNTLIDQFGVPGEDGTGTCHEFEDGRAERAASVTSGNPTWDEAEWNIWADSSVTGPCTNHTGTPQNVADSFDPGAWIGTATAPTITVSSAITGLDYFEGNGPSNEDNFTVAGINLTSDITVNTASPEFEISLTSGSGFGSSVTLPQSSGTVTTTTVYVRLAAGLTANSYSENITASATGATDALVNVSGTVSPATPQFSVFGTPGALNYADGSGPSNEESIFVEGLFLTNDITVTAPTSFEVSLTSGSGFTSSVTVPQVSGTVANTEVFVRLAAGLAVGPYSGDITVSSSPAADQTVALTGNVFGGVTNALTITGVFDALSGSSPKGVELYVLQDIPDLSLFGIGSANNGGGTDGQEFTFPAVSATMGQFIYIVSSGQTADFNAFFGFSPDYESGAMSINGDDAIELFENGQVIDLFGDINVDGTGETWDYVDGWAYRNSAGPNPTFNDTDWTYSGTSTLDGATNASSTNPFPIQDYTLSTNTFEQANFSMYPNPTNTGFVTISSTQNDVIKAQVYNIVGKQVLNQTVTNNTLNVSGLNAGVYIVKLTQNNASITKKLIVQ